MASIEVELLGLDVFDPMTMEVEHRQRATTCLRGSSTPITTTCASTSARHSSRARRRWDNLKKALKGDLRRIGLGPPGRHRRARRSRPGEQRQIAVKVIDDRGNELMVVRSLSG